MNKSIICLLVVLSVVVMQTSCSPAHVRVPNGCPSLPNDAFGLCVDKCENGCPKDWICCPNGCGRYCYNPRTGENNA